MNGYLLYYLSVASSTGVCLRSMTRGSLTHARAFMYRPIERPVEPLLHAPRRFLGNGYINFPYWKAAPMAPSDKYGPAVGQA